MSHSVNQKFESSVCYLNLKEKLLEELHNNNIMKQSGEVAGVIEYNINSSLVKSIRHYIYKL